MAHISCEIVIQNFNLCINLVKKRIKFFVTLMLVANWMPDCYIRILGISIDVDIV